MLVDKNAILQIFGSILKDPSILDNSDRYIFDTTNFTSSFERGVFSAIYNLHKNGASQIAVVDVCNYLEGFPSLYTIFEKENGIEYLNDAIELSQPENFEYYYNRFKKFNLLRDLRKMGYNTNKIYSEDLTDEQTESINKKFDTLTTEDIITKIQNELGILQTDYNRGRAGNAASAYTGLADLVSELKQHPEVGTALQGDIFNTVCRGARRGKLYIRSGSSGSGKALPNSTLIPTPQGWKQVGEIQKGDFLFDAFGKPTRVLEVYPQGKKTVWGVTFKDGRQVKCSEDHLWSYHTAGQKSQAKLNRNFYTKSIKELQDIPLITSKGNNVLVPNNYAVQYPSKNLPIDPYVFGLFLGDGSFRQHSSNKSLQFSSIDDYLPNKIGEIMKWKVKKTSDNNFTWYFEQDNLSGHKNVWVEDFLFSYPKLFNTYSNEKYIPIEYLQGDINQRFALLNGLLDTDGSVDTKGRISYTTNSPKLRDNVIELCQSLGFKGTVYIDSHKSTSICYELIITGRPNDKIKLFTLPRKHQRIIDWFNNTSRKESNDYNPIIKIENLHYEEDMTCFLVDNEEHLFLMNDFIVTHNTRNSVGDACFMAFPFRYNPQTYRWETTGQSEKILYIATEQEQCEIQTLIIAYLTSFNEEKILTGTYDAEEEKIINQAIRLVGMFRDNFIITQIADPDIAKIKSEIRKAHIEHNMTAVFYDYIFSSPALLNEFRDLRIREDVALMMLTTALKDIAVELNLFIMTSTQLSGEYDKTQGIKNQTLLRGSKSIIDKGDIGCIMLPISEEERVRMKEITAKYSIEPNMVTDIYKNRRGHHTNIKIWSYVDLGTCKKTDLFVTNGGYEILDFDIKKYMINFDFDRTFLETLPKDQVCLKPIELKDVEPTTGEIKPSYYGIVDDLSF